MPVVNREKDFSQAMTTAFQGHDWINKIRMAATVGLVMLTWVIPDTLLLKLGLKEDKPNIGRLQEVVKGQIWQQLYYGGMTNATVFQNKTKTGLLLYVVPRMTAEFQQDIKQLGVPVKYILIPDCVHESFGEDAKKTFPDAKVICPAGAKDHVEEVVAVDATVEDEMETLKNEYGFTETFKFDDCFVLGVQRCYAVENFSKPNSNILFVGQCGFGNFESTLKMHALGFASVGRGRMFRQFWYAFTKNKSQVSPFWLNMVSSIPNLEMAIFLHGVPIEGPDTKDKLLDFYLY